MNTRPRRNLAPIPNMTYLSRVYAKTPVKSESLKQRENTIKRKQREVRRNMLVVRKQTREIGWDLESRDSK